MSDVFEPTRWSEATITVDEDRTITVPKRNGTTWQYSHPRILYVAVDYWGWPTADKVTTYLQSDDHYMGMKIFDHGTGTNKSTTGSTMILPVYDPTTATERIIDVWSYSKTAGETKGTLTLTYAQVDDEAWAVVDEVWEPGSAPNEDVYLMGPYNLGTPNRVITLPRRETSSRYHFRQPSPNTDPDTGQRTDLGPKRWIFAMVKFDQLLIDVTTKAYAGQKRQMNIWIDFDVGLWQVGSINLIYHTQTLTTDQTYSLDLGGNWLMYEPFNKSGAYQYDKHSPGAPGDSSDLQWWLRGDGWYYNDWTVRVRAGDATIRIWDEH